MTWRSHTEIAQKQQSNRWLPKVGRDRDFQHQRALKQKRENSSKTLGQSIHKQEVNRAIE